MRTALALVAALALSVPFSGPAAALDCTSDDLNQLELNICSADAFKAADGELNAVYDTLKARLAKNADYSNALVAAQRAWITFRDANCDFTTIGAEGGSIRPLLVAECKTEMTKTRTKELTDILNCPEGDPGCPGRIQ